MNQAEVDAWWQTRVAQDYSVQPKHHACLALLEPGALPLVDLGAGNGTFLALVERRFPEGGVMGVELSQVGADHKTCQAPIEQGSILDWRPREPVETACLIDVLEHMHDPRALLLQVKDYARQIVIACPNFNFLLARVEVLRGNIPFQNKPARGGHVYWCQYQALHALFAECGLEVTAENHLYPRQQLALSRKLGALRPSLFAFEFVFRLRHARST